MTPSAEWYEADADDSDRSIAYDVTASTPETARAATQTGETGAGVHGDADLLRRRTAALDRVAAENERLRADMAALADEWGNRPHPEGAESVQDWVYRTHAASFGSILRAVLARSQEKCRKCDGTGNSRDDLDAPDGECAECKGSGVLARSQAPQAPAEEEGHALTKTYELTFGGWAWECSCRATGVGHRTLTEAVRGHARHPAPSVRPTTADDEGVRRHHHSRKAMECVHNGGDCCVECCEPGGVRE